MVDLEHLPRLTPTTLDGVFALTAAAAEDLVTNGGGEVNPTPGDFVF